MKQNVIIGKPVCEPWLMFANDKNDWKDNEERNTLITEERFLPRILVECGIVKSINEVKRNKPEFVKTLDDVDFIEVKWGKKRVFIQVGE